VTKGSFTTENQTAEFAGFTAFGEYGVKPDRLSYGVETESGG
jgi:hypothetical protein